jgi:hypothetical protein
MANPLLRLISEGKITTFDGLKRAYRRIVMKTHPDAVGSDRLTDKLIEFSGYYEEARQYISRFHAHMFHGPKSVINHRLAFFQQLHVIESLEAPYAIKPADYIKTMKEARLKAYHSFKNWKRDFIDVYVKANEEYELIKLHKPDEPYLRDALNLNLMPVFHNIISFHLTGNHIYKTQMRRNIAAILHRLDQEKLAALKEYISFLIADSFNGPAVFS